MDVRAGWDGFGGRAQRAQSVVQAIFDMAYYLRRYPDVAEAGADPLAHFLSFGWAEGRNPCALFDSELYLERSPDVAQAGLNPLVHYVKSGAREGRQVSLLFDANWYLAKNPDIAEAARANPLAHYLAHGAAEGREANPLFDQAWYLKRYPDAPAEAPCALAHYAERGLSERLSPHPLFDGAFYLDRYPDVARAGMNPLAHFLLRGHEEIRQPHPLFDSAWYLKQYPDIVTARVNPLLHYLWEGAKEGRHPNAEFDTRWYLETYPDTAKAGINPLAHYTEHRRKDTRKAANPTSQSPPQFEAPRDSNGRFLFPHRRRGDGRRLTSYRLDRDHMWYDSPSVQAYVECLDDRPQLPGIRRLLTIGHDFALKTGVMRSLSHYLNALAAAGGYELTSLELAPGADALVALHDIEVHDFLIVNSLPLLFNHANGIELLRRCGLDRVAVYLHETDFVFDKISREKPAEFQAFAEAACDLNFLCVSRQQQEMLARRFGATRMRLVHETSPLDVDGAAISRIQVSTDAPLRIVMAGTLQPRKGVTLFSRVADMAAEAGLPWQFAWAGGEVGMSDGLYRSSNVDFVGELDGAGVIDFLRNADVLLLSSEDDPFPLACLETLQMMKRIVVYRRTGTSEIVDGVGGCAVFDEHSPEAAFAALRSAVETPLDAAACQRLNGTFSLPAFVKRMNEAIVSFYAPPQNVLPVPPSSQQTVAVVVHLFYHDLWHEIRSRLENLRHLCVDLYITLTNDKPRDELERVRQAILQCWPSARVIEVPNQGMDIGPFVEVARLIHREDRAYDLIVKLHTKKSLAASGEVRGAQWRRELLEGLLATPTDVDRIMSIFFDHTEIGMIGPKHMLISKSSRDLAAGCDVNAPNMAALANHMGVADRTQSFFRGAMFWARAADVTEPIVRSDLSIGDFEPGHQPDNSKCHAMERLFACMVRSSGRRLLEYDRALPKPIDLLRNRHKGEDIYVVAAGASNNYLDSKFFQGKCVIGVNRVFVRFPCTYVISKEFGGGEYERELFSSGATPVTAQWDSGNRHEAKMRPNSMVFRDPAYYFFDHLENKRLTVDESVLTPESSKLVVSYSTITSAMHLAAYMGAKNIFLVGHDCGLVDGKAVFDGYYRDMSVSPWASMDDYKSWLGQIESQTIQVRDRLVERFGCSVVSLNPFVNFGLEGHDYKRHAQLGASSNRTSR